jgi:hypothetical protein
MAIGDYTPTDWETGDAITATKLDNNENKTEELDNEIFNEQIKRTFGVKW